MFFLMQLKELKKDEKIKTTTETVDIALPYDLESFISSATSYNAPSFRPRVFLCGLYH
jgi:hypothetical protein